MIKNHKDLDIAALVVVDEARKSLQELSSVVGCVNNIFTIFFHHIVIHFTGVLMVRELSTEEYADAPFPWVNSKYADSPYLLSPSQFGQQPQEKRKYHWLKNNGVLPLEIGNSIPYGYGKHLVLERCMKILAGNETFVRVFLPNRKLQMDCFCNLVHTFCKNFDIQCGDAVLQNWIRHIAAHTVDGQSENKANGVILGTRNEFENRKKAVNFMGQGKKVIGITHGEISNSIYDEPVYGYSDLTLCTTLVDYGDYDELGTLNSPLIDPNKVLRRSSDVVLDLYVRSEEILPIPFVTGEVLYVPTMYQNNYLYGPFHACPNNRYFQWQRALVKTIPEIIVKTHPKSRIQYDLGMPVETRRLEDCIGAYNVIIFDYLATGAVLSMFTKVPVIYFDIGLRRISKTFTADILQRCKVIKIEWNNDLEDQIATGVSSYQNSGSWSNVQMEKYAISSHEKYSHIHMARSVIMD